MTRAGRLPFTFLGLCLAYLAVSVNLSITSIALPSIGEDLGASTDQLSWIFAITPLVSISVMLFAGAWGDRFGRRRILVIGLSIFLASAILSALARDVTALIALRAVTGIGSSLALPAALALTFDVVPELSRRTAVGLIGATQAGGSLIGPVLAGSAMTLWAWPAAFLTVVPFIVIALIGASRLPKGSTGVSVTPMDSRGVTLASIASVAAVFAATSISSRAPLTGLVAILVAVIAIITLIRWERRARHPFFDAAVMHQKRFQVATLVVFGSQVVLGGFLFLLTQYLQLVLGYSPLEAGFMLTPALAGWVLASVAAGTMAARFGVRWSVISGLTLSSGGLALLALAASQGNSPAIGLLLVGLILTGLMAVGPALMTHAAVDSYAPERRAVGSATNGAAARFGFSIGIALFGALLSVVYVRNLGTSTQSLTAEQSEAVQGGLAEAIGVAAKLPDADTLIETARDAYLTGYQSTMMLACVIMAGLALAVGLTSQSVEDARHGST
jgi:MFS family permease